MEQTQGGIVLMGDGQAVFEGLSHNVASGGGYIDINGQIEYGFKVDFSEGQNGFSFVRGGSEIKLRYIDFDGVPATDNYYYNQSTRGISITPWNGSGYDTTTNILISHCRIRGGDTLIQDTNGNRGTIVEYSDLLDSRSTSPSFHSNVYFAGSADGVIRYNLIHNYNAEGIFFTSMFNASNWKIYGNVFYDGGSAARGVDCVKRDRSVTSGSITIPL